MPFKKEYKDHNFVHLVENGRTHTAAEFNVNGFAMKPGIRCPVDKLYYIDEQNNRQTIECYDDDGNCKGLLALAYELNVFVPRKCKLNELKLFPAKHVAFKTVSRDSVFLFSVRNGARLFITVFQIIG